MGTSGIVMIQPSSEATILKKTNQTPVYNCAYSALDARAESSERNTQKLKYNSNKVLSQKENKELLGVMNPIVVDGSSTSVRPRRMHHIW